MCCLPQKKRKNLGVSSPKVSDEPRDLPRSVNSSSAVARCPATQPIIHVKCEASGRDVVGVRVMLGGEDLGLTGGDGKTRPLEGGMVPGRGDAALVLNRQQALAYKPDLVAPAEITYPKRCQDTFIVEAVCLVRPRLKVVFEPGGAAVPGVAVKLAGQDRGSTDGGGIVELRPNEPGLEPDDYALELAFTPDDAKKYRWHTPVPDEVSVADVDDPTITFKVRRLGRPRIELLHQGTNAKAPDVGVKLDAVDFGRTKPDGLAQLAPGADWLEPKDYAVTFDLNAKDVDRYAVVEASPRVTVTEGSEATATFHLRPAATLLVEVLRHDGKQVKGGPVAFTLDGPSGSQVFSTADFDGRDEQLGRDVCEQRKKVTGLAFGDYTITLTGVPALLDAQKRAPTSRQVWSVGPDKDGVAKVKLSSEGVTRVLFTLTKIRKIQFVAFNIKPTEKADTSVGKLPSAKMYHGHADADIDIGARCIILKNAIKKAAVATGIKTQEFVLKVFMTPEFYWRGKEGAYPIEKMSHIMDEMRAETSQVAYKDWLFVFGTALGYLKHGDATPTSRQLAVSGASGVAASSFTVKNHVGSEDLVSVCARIPANWNLSDLLAVPSYRWTLKQGVKQAHVVRSTAGADQYTLEVNAPIDFADGPIELLEPVATEVFNVALVQKGGPAGGVAGVREAIVYKEDVSAIDFLGVMFGKHSEFHQKSGDNRKVEIHGQVRDVLPTEGSRDVLGGNPNAPAVGGASEVTRHGLGGGSIFNVDGITFGLEICRDHLQGKLKNYFVGDPTANPPVAPTASPGDPKVQVQLIPSWGAFIKPEAICGVDGVLVFNVDGPKGAKAGAMAGPVLYACPLHPASTSPAPAVCTVSNHYKCWGMDDVAGPCPHCNAPRASSIPATTAPYHCHSPRHFFLGGISCNVGACTAATKPSHYWCPACHGASPVAGPCTNGACATKPPLLEVRYCDAVPHAHPTTAVCQCGATPVARSLYYCTAHTHFQVTSGACTGCLGFDVSQVDPFKMSAKDVVAAVGGAATPVLDAAGDFTTVTEADVVDGTSPTGFKTTYTPTTANVTPAQTDYYETAGSIVVYPWMDVPPAQTV